MAKSTALDKSQPATIASSSEGSDAKAAPMDNNLEILRPLSKKLRLISFYKANDAENLKMEVQRESVITFNIEKKEWEDLKSKQSWGKGSRPSVKPLRRVLRIPPEWRFLQRFEDFSPQGRKCQGSHHQLPKQQLGYGWKQEICSYQSC